MATDVTWEYKRTAARVLAELEKTLGKDLEELPEHLKEEIQNLGSWIRDGLLTVGESANREKKEDTLRFYFKDSRDSDLDEEATLRDVEDLTNNMRLSAQELEQELERIPLTTDSTRLDNCVVALREVLGPLGEPF